MYRSCVSAQLNKGLTRIGVRPSSCLGLINGRFWVCISENPGKEVRHGQRANDLFPFPPPDGGGLNSASIGATL